MWATSIRLFLLRRGHYHWSTREIDPIKILMKGLFDFLSPVDLCPRLSNIRPPSWDLIDAGYRNKRPINV